MPTTDSSPSTSTDPLKTLNRWLTLPQALFGSKLAQAIIALDARKNVIKAFYHFILTVLMRDFHKVDNEETRHLATIICLIFNDTSLNHNNKICLDSVVKLKKLC